MSPLPMPSTVVDVPYAWVEVCCAGCGESFGYVASFDLPRVPAPVHCRGCVAWRELCCARCRVLLGGTHEPHDAPVVYCPLCRANDELARVRREAKEQLAGDVRPPRLPQGFAVPAATAGERTAQ